LRKTLFYERFSIFHDPGFLGKNSPKTCKRFQK
jgi:hypothetical protein